MWSRQKMIFHISDTFSNTKIKPLDNNVFPHNTVETQHCQYYMIRVGFFRSHLSLCNLFLKFLYSSTGNNLNEKNWIQCNVWRKWSWRFATLDATHPLHREWFTRHVWEPWLSTTMPPHAPPHAPPVTTCDWILGLQGVNKMRQHNAELLFFFLL